MSVDLEEEDGLTQTDTTLSTYGSFDFTHRVIINRPTIIAPAPPSLYQPLTPIHTLLSLTRRFVHLQLTHPPPPPQWVSELEHRSALRTRRPRPLSDVPPLQPPADSWTTMSTLEWTPLQQHTSDHSRASHESTERTVQVDAAGRGRMMRRTGEDEVDAFMQQRDRIGLNPEDDDRKDDEDDDDRDARVLDLPDDEEPEEAEDEEDEDDEEELGEDELYAEEPEDAFRPLASRRHTGLGQTSSRGSGHCERRSG